MWLILLLKHGFQMCTLTGLHVQVGPRAVGGHGLPLAHVYLPLWLYSLRGGHCVVIRPHGAMTAGWHVNGAAGYAGGLVGPGALHGHVGWTCRSRQRLKSHETLKHIFLRCKHICTGCTSVKTTIQGFKAKNYFADTAKWNSRTFKDYFLVFKD